MRTVFLWAGAVLAALALVIAVVLIVIDEPLRRYAERQLNSRIEGYPFRIGKLDVHPIKLGVELEDVTVIPKEHPDPPVVRFAKWRAGLHWSALRSGRIVSDHEIERPQVGNRHCRRQGRFFLSEPHPGGRADFEVSRVSLEDLIEILGRYHIQLLRKGLLSAVGTSRVRLRLRP